LVGLLFTTALGFLASEGCSRIDWTLIENADSFMAEFDAGAEAYFSRLQDGTLIGTVACTGKSYLEVIAETVPS
jgi:hypothetical protein